MDFEPEKSLRRTALWKGLFDFAPSCCSLSFLFACSTSILAGLLTPIQAIIFGKIFQAFVTLSSGLVSEKDFYELISRQCLLLALLGFGYCLVHSSFFLFWERFGASTARNASIGMLKALVGRDIYWFENQRDGINSLATRIHTSVL